MGRIALSRRRLAVAITSVALAVAGGAVLPAPATAAPVAPWRTATAITGTDVDTYVLDVVTATDGSAVAVWNQFAGTAGTERKLYAAVRAADSDTWGAPTLLATTPTEAGDAKLHAAADGTVTALWVEMPDNLKPDDGNYGVRLVSSVLDAGHSGWSAPTGIVGTDTAWSDGGFDLAEAPDGSLTAVWGTRADSASPYEVHSATRGADGTWSAPAQLSATAADGADAAYAPSVAVTPDGTTVVVYKQTDGPSASLRTVTRAADSTGWSAPAPATGSYQSVGEPEIAAADDGSVTLAWPGTDEAEDTSILTATRSAGDGTWSAPETVTATDNPAGTPEPLLAPDGDVTLVWVDYTTSYGTRTTTREADTGTWSAVKTLSTSSVAEAWDAAVGADGTVRALWPQTGGGGRVLMESVRTDGEWTTAAQLPGSAHAYVLGQVSVGPDGAATAVWSGAASSTANWRLHGSRTAWPTTLQLASSTIPEVADLKNSAGWAPTFGLNRPALTWTLTLTDTLKGATQRVLTGTVSPDHTITPLWDGRTTSGSYVPNGQYAWKLDAVVEEGGTPVQVGSGWFGVTGGAAVARDHGDTHGTTDGVGDLLTLNSKGALTFQIGKATTGTFSGKLVGTEWATTVRAVPVGDLNGDRCNDVLVRYSSGALRLYKPGCGKALTLNAPYTTLATSGWTQYDILTSPGDISGDKRPDLIARNSSTGTVYLYKGTSTGKLASRVKLYDNWKGYKKIVGAGDLNGDGHGDLLAQDSANTLWRYNGTGSGTFKARVKVFGNWGGSYNAVVGVGDITGDGKADLVSRDTSGNVWRNNGDGKGSFGSRAQIATGWGGYKFLS